MVQNFGSKLTDPHMSRLVKAISALDGARILLTGGTGFVGKWLIEIAKIAHENSQSRIEIVVPTRNLTSVHALATRAIGFTELSLVEGDLLTAELNVGNIDMIIHAATPASAELNESDPQEMLRINSQSMISALHYAKNGVPFLFTSSGAVYGLQPQSISHFMEGVAMPSAPEQQLTAYGKGKQVAESLCVEAGLSQACSPIIARLFTFSGNHLPRNTHFAIGNFVQNVLDRKPIFINSDGQSRRSYLFGADMATWLWCALSEREIAQPLHVGSERSISILELAQVVAKVSEQILNFKPDINLAIPASNKTIFHQYVPATVMTRSFLKTEEWTSLEKSIELMIKSELN